MSDSMLPCIAREAQSVMEHQMARSLQVWVKGHQGLQVKGDVKRKSYGRIKSLSRLTRVCRSLNALKSKQSLDSCRSPVRDASLIKFL